jgi:hypothetical protein
VYEHVLAAAFRRDEAKALGGIEELNGTNRHDDFLEAVVSAGAECANGRELEYRGREVFGSSGAPKRVRVTEALRLTGQKNYVDMLYPIRPDMARRAAFGAIMKADRQVACFTLRRCPRAACREKVP